jgi:glycosyltransferase involved in cell wall biosynthesis
LRELLPVTKNNSVIALLPFLVKGALSLIVLRAMRERGIDVSIAYYMRRAEGYTADDCGDFRGDGRLIDLVDTTSDEAIIKITDTCRERNARLLLQIGAPHAYRQIPYVRERCPDLLVYDILYNPIGHTVNHFLYESAFDAAVVESRAMENFVNENTLLSDKVTHVMESGIDLTDFYPRSGVVSNGDVFVLGYVGRMSPEKNPLGFIEMAEQLADRLPHLRFRIFGEGPQLNDVQERLRVSRAANVIQLDGYIPHVRDAMHMIDCLVVPSKLDGRPNIVMEANACGVPVIGSPVGGIPELIDEGINGYIKASTDIEGIAAVVSAMSANADLTSALQKNSRAAAERRFNRSKMLDAYADLFSMKGH